MGAHAPSRPTERVGLDVGGSAIKGGRVDARGEVRERRRLELPDGATPAERLELLIGFARELRAPAAGGLGLGLPGLLDRGRGCITRSPNLPWLDGLPLQHGLARGLELAPEAVRVENDANVAALGEQWLGAAAGERHCLVVTLGTGIGGGLVLDGRLFIGEGFAGEIGHVTVDPAGPVCACGSRGCLETLASATAAGRRARAAGLTDDLEQLSARARRAPEGPEAVLLADVGRDLGRGLAAAVLLLDLHCFVFGGGFSAALDLLAGGIREGLRERAYGERVSGLRLLPAALGADAGWIGAARLAFPAPAEVDA